VPTSRFTESVPPSLVGRGPFGTAQGRLQTPTRLRADGIPLRDMWELQKQL